VTVIEIRPFRNGWKSYEGPGVEPVFATKEQAIGYAQVRACFRSGEIRILDSNSRIERVILFNDTERKCNNTELAGFPPRLLSTVGAKANYDFVGSHLAS